MKRYIKSYSGPSEKIEVSQEKRHRNTLQVYLSLDERP